MSPVLPEILHKNKGTWEFKNGSPIAKANAPAEVKRAIAEYNKEFPNNEDKATQTEDGFFC